MWRRVGLTGLLVLVLAALTGWLGPRTDKAALVLPTGADATIESTSITRPGLDTEVVVTVPEAGDSVIVTVDRALISDLGIEAMTPEPEGQSAAGDAVVLTFAIDGRGPFELELSGRTPTAAVPQRHTYRLVMAIDDGPVASHTFHTWVLP